MSFFEYWFGGDKKQPNPQKPGKGRDRHPRMAQRSQKTVKGQNDRGILWEQAADVVSDMEEVYAGTTVDKDHHKCFYKPVPNTRLATACTCGNVYDPENEI